MATQPRLVVDAIARAIARELATFVELLRRLPDDDSVWVVPPGAVNSAGTLALHVAGNLLHFVGATLGGTGYVRDRGAEFAIRGVGRAELCGRLEETARVVAATLGRLDDAALPAPFPAEIASLRFSNGAALVQLATHLAYHLGQADAIRRSLSADTAGVGAVSPKPLADLVA